MKEKILKEIDNNKDQILKLQEKQRELRNNLKEIVKEEKVAKLNCSLNSSPELLRFSQLEIYCIEKLRVDGNWCIELPIVYPGKYWKMKHCPKSEELFEILKSNFPGITKEELSNYRLMKYLLTKNSKKTSIDIEKHCSEFFT